MINQQWTKSERSMANNECVEVRRGPNGLIEVRNSKNPDDGVTAFTDAEWDAFLHGAKRGEFDL